MDNFETLSAIADQRSKKQAQIERQSENERMLESASFSEKVNSRIL